MEQLQAPARLPGLDAARAVALWCTLTFHFNVSVQAACPGAPVVGFMHYAGGELGHIGVTLFFVLSGAALMHRYEAACTPGGYYKKRLLAIYPMYWAGFLALFLYSDILHHNLPAGVPLRRLIWSALALDGYIQEVLPTFYKIGEWFIGCIILLYLVFPLLRIALLKKPALLAAALVFFHVGWVLFYPGVVQIEHSAASRLLEFAAGMYLARYWKRLPRWAPFAGCAAALLVLLVPLPGPRMFWLPLLGAGMFLILMWAGEFITACWARIALQKIAQLSYPLYLVHHVTLTILFVPRLNGHILGLGGVWAIYFLYLATAALAAAALQVVAKAVQKAGWVLAGKKVAVRR